MGSTDKRADFVGPWHDMGLAFASVRPATADAGRQMRSCGSQGGLPATAVLPARSCSLSWGGAAAGGRGCYAADDDDGAGVAVAAVGRNAIAGCGGRWFQPRYVAAAVATAPGLIGQCGSG